MRPEGWAPAGQGIPAMVTLIEHLGAETLCHLEGGAVLRLAPDMACGMVPGQALRLAVHKAVLFGPDGQRLPLRAAHREPALG